MGAKALSVSQQLIAAYELGKRRIHVKFLKKVAEVLSVTIDDLLGIKSSKNKPGPVPKIQRLLIQIQKLPLNKQKTVLDFLDSFIHSNVNKSA
jgi:transcriptional regulator with XRE-family HTH domain